MSWLMDASFGLAAVNLVLLGLLLYPSGRNAVRTRSPVAAALVVFVVIFMVEGVITIFFHVSMMRFYTPGVEPQVLATSLLKTVSFASLLWVTYR